MQLRGETQIAAPRQRVWDVLTDPHQVAACAPGDPAVEVLDERLIRISVEVRNLFFRTTVTIDLQLDEMAPPSRATGRASGNVMGGSVSAIGSLALEELGPAVTAVAWEAEVALGGMLAGFAGMAEQPAGEAMERTLACLKARLEGEAAGSTAPAG